ncbi:hypothetical protein [Polyangium aurulentum]|uniref:hypothetical protein n=1 Tax=Polyangium aurulentum TaxID=2567896 RepID=UPI0010AEBEA7|nr:hypothetical protein [Polyangium aurulentum]UQA61616.1 hypothetical protein E8A73_014545 [Polyangium aurulentum]
MTASPSTHVGSTSLARLLDQRAPAREIAAFLDDLAPDARLGEVLSITGSKVGRLYDAVADAEPLTVDEFFPPSTSGTLIYEGRNSLPLFSRFQKRFARVGSGVIVGYNHQTMAPVTGPGFFVVKPASGTGEHGKEMFFDYTVEPPEFPAGFPTYKPNTSGLSRLVYMNMIDYCRRVARGVVVGKAYKLGVDQKAWFSLTLPG